MMLMITNRLIAAIGLLLNLVVVLSVSPAYGQQHACKEPGVHEFLEAARLNEPDCLKQGLLLNVPVDSRDEKGRTALLIATYANAIDAARILIAAGADINAKDQLEDSPFLYAGAEGKLEILKMTVAAGADLKSINRYGGTALTPAAHHGHVEVVEYLLTTTIDVNQVNNLGWTALLEAVILGDGRPPYPKIVELLLHHGADMTLGDDQGVTALKHARARNQDEIIALLELAGNRRE
jgi:ankyrin repeat protein